MANVENQDDQYKVKDDEGNIKNVIPTTSSSSTSKLYEELTSYGDSNTGPVNLSDNRSLFANFHAQVGNTSDPYAYAKPTTFNSTHTGLNFDRYYNHPNFEKLGFSPYRDNESIYNNNSSWFDDFRRATGQYGTLWSTGFSSILKNWGTLSSGFISTNPDLKSADNMQKAMSIGSSSRKGFGSKVTNFYLNTAYTAGVLSEIAAEEIALMGLTALTGTAAAPAAAARSAANTIRGTKAIMQGFKAANKLSNARKAWNVAKKIVPFGDTVDIVRGLSVGDAATLKRVKDNQGSLTELAKLKETFGTFYREVREINAASAESRLEAGMVVNDTADTLINEFYARNGRMPNNEEIQVIHDRAKMAGAQTFMYNMPAIYFSNRIVLETALKGFRPLRKIMSKTPSNLRPITRTVDGKKTVKVSDMSNPSIYFSRSYWKNVGKHMSPRRILGGGLRYSSANITEGLQEVYQESLAAGLINHYTDERWGMQRIGEADLWNSLKMGFHELDEQNMALETFISGFFMAGPVQGVQSVLFKGAPKLGSRLFNPKEYKKYQESKQKSIENLEKALNDLVNDPEKWTNTIQQNARLQNMLVKEQHSAEESGDIKAARDAVDEQVINHVHTLLQHNMLEEFQDQLRDFASMNDEELSQAFREGKEIEGDSYNSDLRTKINKTIKISEDIEKNFRRIEEQWINPFSRKDEWSDYMGFETAKKHLLFNEQMTVRTAERMGELIQVMASNKKLAQLLSGDITSLLDVTEIITKKGFDLKSGELNMGVGGLELLISNLKDSVKTYKEGNENDQKIAEKKQEQLDALIEFQKAMRKYEGAYENITRNGIAPEEVQEQLEKESRYPRGTDVEYTTKKGEKKKGVVVAVSGNNAVIEITNKAGKKQRVAVSLDRTAIIGEPKKVDGKEVYTESQEYTDAMKYLFEALFGKVDSSQKDKVEGPKGYLNILAGTDGIQMTRDEIAEIFNAFTDFIRLRRDRSRYARTVNYLTDPGYFGSSAERFAEVERAMTRISKEKIQEMKTKFQAVIDDHRLLQDLFAIGVFMDPEEVKAFKDDNVMPTKFYAATDLEGVRAMTEIIPNVHQHIYKQIMEVIEKYEEEKNVEFTGKIDFNIAKQGEMANQVFRKLQQDDRTIKQLAEEYGFNLDEKSTLTVSELLSKILSSGKLLPADSILIRKLLTVVSDDFSITIDRGHAVAVSHDSGSGVVVNPNFASANYREGYLSFERLVLNGIMQKLVKDQLETNSQFKSDVESLMGKVKEGIANGDLNEFFDKLQEEDKIFFNRNSKGDVIVDDVYGLKSPEQFLALALTDPVFQSILAGVKVDTEAKSIWEEIIEAIKLAIQKLAGTYADNNALDHATSLVTTSVFQLGNSPIVPDDITVNTPIENMPENLQKELKTAWDALSIEEQGDYGKIQDWIKGSSDANTIISNYRRKMPREEREELFNKVLTKGQWFWLRNHSDLNDDEIYSMSLNELVQIVEGQYRRVEPDERPISSAESRKGIRQLTFNGIEMINRPIEDLDPSREEVEARLDQVGNELNDLLISKLGTVDKPIFGLIKDATEEVVDQVLEQVKQAYIAAGLDFSEELGHKIRYRLSDPKDFFFRVTSLKRVAEDMKTLKGDNKAEKFKEAIENHLTYEMLDPKHKWNIEAWEKLSESAKEEYGDIETYLQRSQERMFNGADRGTLLDDFFRLTLQLRPNEIPYEEASKDEATLKEWVERNLQKAYDNVKNGLNIQREITWDDKFVESLTKTLTQIQQWMKDNNYRALTNVNTLFGDIGLYPVSGQVDLIFYNDAGEILVLDMKTMTEKNDRTELEGYEKKMNRGKFADDRWGYVEKDTVQLNIYRELLEKLIGQEVDKSEALSGIKGLGIIPLIVEFNYAGAGARKLKTASLSPNVTNEKRKGEPLGIYIPVRQESTRKKFPELFAEDEPQESMISQKNLSENKVIYISPAIYLSDKIADDPMVLFYDDFQIEALNELGFIKRTVTRKTLLGTIAEIYDRKTYTKEQIKKAGVALNQTAYNAAIAELNESDGKTLITRSKLFITKHSDDVSVAIVPDKLNGYSSKGIESYALLEQSAFRVGSRLRVLTPRGDGAYAKAGDTIEKALRGDIQKLSQQRTMSIALSGVAYEDWVSKAELDGLFIVLTELDTMQDIDFEFNQEIPEHILEAAKKKAKRDEAAGRKVDPFAAEKNYLYSLISEEIKKRMVNGITTAKQLLTVAKQNSVVKVEVYDKKGNLDIGLYPLGLAYVTKEGYVKPIYEDESTGSDQFKRYGRAPSKNVRVVKVMRLEEVLPTEDVEITEEGNEQAAENLEDLIRGSMDQKQEEEIANQDHNVDDTLNDLTDNICD